MRSRKKKEEEKVKAVGDNEITWDRKSQIVTDPKRKKKNEKCNWLKWRVARDSSFASYLFSFPHLSNSLRLHDVSLALSLVLALWA